MSLCTNPDCHIMKLIKEAIAHVANNDRTGERLIYLTQKHNLIPADHKPAVAVGIYVGLMLSDEAKALILDDRTTTEQSLLN